MERGTLSVYSSDGFSSLGTTSYKFPLDAIERRLGLVLQEQTAIGQAWAFYPSELLYSGSSWQTINEASRFALMGPGQPQLRTCCQVHLAF